MRVELRVGVPQSTPQLRATGAVSHRVAMAV